MPVTEETTCGAAAMTGKPVRLETVSWGVNAPQLFYILLRFFLFGLGVWVLLPQPRVLPDVFWSAASFDKAPMLGYVCDVVSRIGLFVAFAASLSFTCFKLWFNLVNVRRRTRSVQTTSGGLVVGRATGIEEQIPYSNIGRVMVRRTAVLTSVRVTTVAGQKIGLLVNIEDANALDSFCAECARESVPVTGETRSLWRSAVPFLVAGPVLVLLLLAARYAMIR